MSADEEKAIEVLEEFKKTGYHTLYIKYKKDRVQTTLMIEYAIDTVLNLIKKQQAEIEKEDKIINEMADKLSEYTCWNKDDLNMNKLAPIEEIIDYFTNKVEGE